MRGDGHSFSMRWLTAAVSTLLVCGGCHRATNQSSTTTREIDPSAWMAKPKPPVERWEYVTFAPPDVVYDETLNRLGADGWELVTARRVKSDALGGEMAYEITMRRHQRPGVPPTTAAEQTAIAVKAAEPKRQAATDAAIHDALQVVREKAREMGIKTETTSTAPPIPRGALSVQVFADRDSRTYFAENCEHPRNALKMPRTVAAAEGYTPAPACYH
jgi:hypothetical protein